MKSVLISIQPKWCELIAIGKKTIEVRKRKPNLAPPFKVYIYQTRRTWIYDIYSRIADWQGKVIGEFVCDEIHPIKVFSNCAVQNWICFGLARSELSLIDVANYIGANRTGYGWHISNLKIYDKPKELSEFRLYNVRAYYDEELKLPMPTHEISRPPQSWCYVEAL